MELLEIIRALMEKFSADKAEVVKQLQKEGQPVFQMIFDKGHAAATAAAKTDKTALETKVTELETRITELTGKLAEAPDVGKVRQEYETVITQLKTEHKEAIGKLKQSYTDERRNTQLERFKANLIKAGVDPDYAEVIAARPDLKDRIRFRQDDGKLEVLQAGGTVPFAPGDGEDGIDLLVKEVRAATPAKFITSDVDDGSGGRGGSAGGGSGYAAYRKQVEAERKTQTREADDSAASRLAGAR